MVEQESGKVSWNISSQQAYHIFSLIEKATNFYLDGRLDKWYWTLSALRECVNHELKSDREKELDVLEKTCNTNFASWKKMRSQRESKPNTPQEGKQSSNFSSNIRIYQREVMKTLKELGFFPSKENRAKLGF